MNRKSGISRIGFRFGFVTAPAAAIGAVGAAALVAGCSLALDTDPEAAGPDDTDAAEAAAAAAAAEAAADTIVEFTGRVAAEGTQQADYLVLRVPDDAPVALAGPLAGELRRLQNASIRVRGSHEARGLARGGTVEVRSYSVLSIDGERPEVGVLLRRDGDFWLVAEENTLRISGMPSELTDREGAKIWVTGPRSAGTLQLRSYGILRAPPE